MSDEFDVASYPDEFTIVRVGDEFTVEIWPDEFIIHDNTDDWVIYTTTETEYTLEFQAVGLNDAAITIAARDAAIAAQVQADADVVLTHFDVTLTHADVTYTHADVVLTHADVVQTGLDKVATAADRVQTGLDKAATAADRVQTGLDRTQTGLDKAATAADRVQTGLDRVQTGLDRVQTGLDRVATGNDVATANALLAAFTGGLTGQILIKTSNANYAFGWQNPTGMLTAIYDPTNIAADVFARANHTGTQLAATISDFSTAADARITAKIGVTLQGYTAILAATTASYTVALDTKLGGIATGADVTVSALPVAIHGAASKATPVDADELALSDSAAAFGLKKLTWLNVKATLKTYFDTLYSTSATVATQIAAYAFSVAAKTTLVGADTVNITDSAAANVDKKITWTNMLEQIRVFLVATNKAVPVDADLVPMWDSAVAYAPKYSTWTQMKAFLKTYFDTQYGLLAGANSWVARQIIVGGGTGNSAMATATASLGELEVRGNGTGASMIALHRPGSFASYFGIDTDNKLKWGGWSNGANSYELVHQANLSTYVAFTGSFVSTQQTITAGGALTLAHGLGVKPKLYKAYLQCTTAEGGYSIGDEVSFNDHYQAGLDVAGGISVVPDATNLNVRFGSNANLASMINKTTGARFFLTNANWKLVLRAWA